MEEFIDRKDDPIEVDPVSIEPININFLNFSSSYRQVTKRTCIKFMALIFIYVVLGLSLWGFKSDFLK